MEINGNTLSSSRMNQIKEIVEAESAIRGSLMMNGWSLQLTDTEISKKHD